jgi:beta-aspartyl-peptidase (threonine type)
MRRLLQFVVLICFSIASYSAEDKRNEVAIAIHGGAGTISADAMTETQKKQYIETLKHAVETGYTALKKGDTGEVALIKTIQILEESPLFNAGRGAVYTFDEEHELDASIMLGQNRQAGAVSGVKTIKSPIAAAAAVMNHSPHVLLSGKGAESFAVDQGLQQVDNAYFNTERRFKSLQRVKQRMQVSKREDVRTTNEKMGTVGAVVLDSYGNIAAGTSTGGMTAKRFNRIGDSPIIGAGTFADNASCAVSATGHGEFFIRYNVAADVCARMRYAGKSLTESADIVINQALKNVGGTGGIIAIDAKGNIAMPFNTSGMYRASINVDGELQVGIFKHNEIE